MQPTTQNTRIIKHLSVSQIQDWISCPLRWAGRRQFGWPEKPVVDLLMGSAMHKAIEAHHRGGDPQLTLMAEWAGVRLAGPPPGAQERSLAVLTAYCNSHPAEIGDQPEVTFYAALPGLPVKLMGIFDCLRGREVHEYKTGRTKWTQEKVDTELQATAYWFAHHVKTGRYPERMVYHSLNTWDGETITDLVTVRTEAQVEAFTLLCQRVYQEMLTAPLTPKCQQRYCRFPDHCRAVPPEHVDALDEAEQEYRALGELVDVLHDSGQTKAAQGLIEGAYARARERCLELAAVEPEPLSEVA